MTLSCQLYKPSVWRWIDSCQNQAFADKYHMGISGLRWKTGRFEVKFCISSTSIVSAVNRMAARMFRERQRERKNVSFFRLNFNVHINMDNREKARARNITETNLVGRKTWKTYRAGEKWEMLVATKVKMSGSEKTKVNRNIKISSIRRVTREFIEVSRFSRANWRQGNIQKVCRTCKVVVFFAN